MKLTFLLWLCLLSVVPCAAQTSCNVTAGETPKLFGLKLEMTPEQVQSVFGRDLRIKIKKNGERAFFQNFIKKPAPAVLAGVRALYLRFLDRRLYQIEIFYENKLEWQTLDGFTNYLSTKLELSATDWKDVRGKRELRCGNLTLVADQVLNPRIEITDEQARARAEELRTQNAGK